mgnify:CR=1 FL=1
MERHRGNDRWPQQRGHGLGVGHDLRQGGHDQLDFDPPVAERMRALALREAAAQTAITMLEPFDTVTVEVPDELVGNVMSDLSARRAHLLGTDKDGDNRTQVLAEVPQTELVSYAVDLRAATHGSGTFSRSFGHYEPMPEDVAKSVTPRPTA